MTVIAVGAIKGAPGVTTTVLAMAAVWPAERGVVIAEVDPDGGVLAARRGLAREPGLVTLAAALRRGGEPARDHAQAIGTDVHVIVAPPSVEQTRAALAVAGEHLGQALAALSEDVLVDCGRLTVTSPALAVARRATTTLMLAQPRLEDVALLRDRVPALRREGMEPRVLLAGHGPYDRDEVAEAAEVTVISALPQDPRSAGALDGRSSRRPSPRAPLLRAARHIASTLRDDAGTPSETTP